MSKPESPPQTAQNPQRQAPPSSIGQTAAKALPGKAPAAQVDQARQAAKSAQAAPPRAPGPPLAKTKPMLPGLPGGLSGGGSIGPTISKTEVLAVNLSASAAARARNLGFSVDNGSPLTSLKSAVTRLTPPTGINVLDARTILQAELPAESFALNRIYRLYHPQSAPRPSDRTAPAAHDASTACFSDRCAGRQLIHWKPQLQSCTTGLRIGVIDTDIDHQHPAFPVGKFKLGNFIPEDRKSAPNWHGTGVVALLAGQQKSGTPGLVSQSDFFVANVFFTDDDGDFATDTVSILKALDWMSALDVQLVNMSFAGPRDDLVQKAVASMSNKGVVFVAAAGNLGPTAPPSYPAAYKQVIAVTAVNKDQRNYPDSNRGDHIDVAAPGVDVWTAVPGGREGYLSGTSFAAPYVTSIIATILANSPRRQKTDLLNALQVIDLGQPGRDPIYGRGLLIAPDSCNPQAVAAASAGQQPSTQAFSSGTSWTTVSTKAVVAPSGGMSAGFR